MNKIATTIAGLIDRTKPLPERIGAALSGPDTPSSSIGSLLAEVDTSLLAARTEASHLEAVALEPLLSSEAYQAAEGAMNAANFKVRRLDVMRQRLVEFKDQRIAEEREAVKWAAYRAAEKAAAKSAQRIKAEYPGLAERLQSLLQEMCGAAHAVNQVNRDLPEGAPLLDRPEGRARGWPADNWTVNGEAGPVSLACMVIPALTGDAMLWPPGITAEKLRMYGVGSSDAIVATHHTKT